MSHQEVPTGPAPFVSLTDTRDNGPDWGLILILAVIPVVVAWLLVGVTERVVVWLHDRRARLGVPEGSGLSPEESEILSDLIPFGHPDTWDADPGRVEDVLAHLARTSPELYRQWQSSLDHPYQGRSDGSTT